MESKQKHSVSDSVGKAARMHKENLKFIRTFNESYQDKLMNNLEKKKAIKK